MQIKLALPSEIPSSWKGKNLGLDIETESLDFKSPITLLSLYNLQEDISLVIPIKTYSNTTDIYTELSDIEKSILKDFLSSIKAVGHNLQFDLSRIYDQFGVAIPVYFDTFIMARVFQLELNALKDIFINLYPDKASLIRKFENIFTPDEDGKFRYDIENKLVLQYSALDSVLPFRIMEYYKDNIIQQKKVLQLEFDFISEVIKSSGRGILFDADKFTEIENTVNKKYDIDLNNFCKKIGKETFRPNAFSDLNNFLVEEKKFEIPLKSPKGKPSFNAQSLNMLSENLANKGETENSKIITDILELKHNLSVKNSLKKVTSMVSDDGAFHPVFESVGYGTASSRVYVKDPIVSAYPAEFRKSIIPHKGNKFLYADWKSAELYIAAYLSNCKTLLDWFNRGVDLHTEIAKRLLGKIEISKEERNVSKVVSFSTIFGSAGAATARALNISYEDGQKLVNKYFSLFPELAKFRDDVIAKTRKNGYTETIIGRRRTLVNINSFDESEKSADERRAFNTAIQSSCADFFKMVVRRTKDIKDIQWVLGVFDSHLIEVPETYTDRQAEELLDSLFDFSDLYKDFKFKYEWAFGSNWYEAYEKC